ncbi:hypothetical protein BDY21DRAFT_292971 [Lineolata rhizophorae]|uniref:DUF155 domain-containing protein n=1 Tax=Lineolata rhizophorae TaxID=578093 RepID=A0A6A6NNU1_9PEZI|nr:hypothetical protein BDY21DRAFT_292971 [Lineolata rhizophorae]
MSATTARTKRGPTVLVTDSREARPPTAGGPARPGPFPQPTKNSRLSVDSILGYGSDIPSAQRREPPELRPRYHSRTPSGRHPLDPKLTGRMAPQHVPARSSKVSEKLVLLPEANEGDVGAMIMTEEGGPPRDSEVEARRRQKLVPGALLTDKSYAERLPKARRIAEPTLARVTAYCVAQTYRLRATAEFVRTQHGARAKLYDDCLYVVYQLPLMPGYEGYRIKSSPVLKNPGGRAVLDEEIERNERRGYREGYFEDDAQYGIKADESPRAENKFCGERRRRGSSVSSGEGQDERNQYKDTRDDGEVDSGPRENGKGPSHTSHHISPTALHFAEMFVFSYGVVVFWNFSHRQEKDALADMTFATGNIPLASRPAQNEEDFETEEFHFEYSESISRPRVFNDMITLTSGDHMIKLAISHAIAQSTKLCFFEERMAHTMIEAQHVPRRLALTGKLGMKREDVIKILGKLFTSRVDVNLSSNMLDVPNFFWDSEPTLHPLYAAVREYLEIKPRVQVLNERCRVFLDLAEILSDAIADKKMTRITWIIIVLIIISIVVTCTEVFLRFGILHSGNRGPVSGELPPEAFKVML